MATHIAQWNLSNICGRSPAQRPITDIRDLIRANDDLPPLPEISRRLLHFRNDPNASAMGLTQIVELDPMLSGQMLRWANSAYYGLRNPTDSVRDAIVRVLGFNTSLALALALAALSPLQTPNQGPLGRDRLWRHGIQSGILMRELAAALPNESRPSTGTIQLAGLMQNIGYLLLGHLLPEPFHLLSRLIESNQTLTLPNLDRLALGVEHGQLGLWLLEVWDMPPALRTVIRQHHNPGYEGEHETLVLLTALADSLLHDLQRGLGAPPIIDNSRAPLLARLGIDSEACRIAMEKIRTPEE